MASTSQTLDGSESAPRVGVRGGETLEAGAAVLEARAALDQAQRAPSTPRGMVWAAAAAAAAAIAMRNRGDSTPPAAPGADGESKIGGPSPPGDPPALRDDPKYAKYFKMIEMGLPIGAVKNAFERDGLDPAIMDGDHSKPVTRAVPLREDE